MSPQIFIEEMREDGTLYCSYIFSAQYSAWHLVGTQIFTELVIESSCQVSLFFFLTLFWLMFAYHLMHLSLPAVDLTPGPQQ